MALISIIVKLHRRQQEFIANKNSLLCISLSAFSKCFHMPNMKYKRAVDNGPVSLCTNCFTNLAEISTDWHPRGVLPYINHISMYRPKGFLHRFGLETGILFEGTTGRECMNIFIVAVPNEWERKRNMPFCWRSNLSNDDNFFEARSEYGYEK